MAQPVLGAGVLHANGAGGCGFLGDWFFCNNCCDWRADDFDSPPPGVAGDSALDSVTVLRLLDRLWISADLYSAALAAFVLQLAVWNGVVARAWAVCGACCAVD